MSSKAFSRSSSRGFWFSLLGVLFFAAAAAGYRQHYWELKTAFILVRGAFCLGVLGFLLSLLAYILRRPYDPRFRSTAGLLLSVGLVGGLGYHIYKANHVPRIHDITTDTQDPPVFDKLLQVHAPNSAVYGGQAVAEQQLRAYPNVKPLEIAGTVPDVFRDVQSVAESMEWNVVDAEPAKGLLEATETSRLFGFKDDIVVRLRPLGNDRVRVDLRSASRIGLSDLGVNAGRVQGFLKKLRARTSAGSQLSLKKGGVLRQLRDVASHIFDMGDR